jgi:hypothetical protein
MVSNMKSLVLCHGGSVGRCSKHCFSLKELAMNDAVLDQRLELVFKPSAEGVEKAAAD